MKNNKTNRCPICLNPSRGDFHVCWRVWAQLAYVSKKQATVNINYILQGKKDKQERKYTHLHATR